MSKRQHRQLNGDRAGKRSRLAPKKHLYLFLDDWDGGYSMHKIDADALQDNHNATDDEQVGFPEPAVLRLGEPQLHPSVLGSDIFIVTAPRCEQTPILVYNTQTGALTMGPRLPAPLLNCFDIAVAACDRLYGLSALPLEGGPKEHAFEVLSRAPIGSNNKHPQWFTRPRTNWFWKTVPSTPPLDEDEWITSYALHPDGHTIFVSAQDSDDPRLTKGTYSFDAKRCEWRRHGKWALPFRGQGYFDSDLEAWVGLRSDGYVCACQVASRSSTTSATQPDWKVSKDKLFCSESKRHISATLTYMGDGQFCLVHCVVHEQMEREGAFGDCDGCVLRLVVFSLRYNHKGELQTKIRRTTNTVVSKHPGSFQPVAFWM